jgi:hypothetical protein
VHTQHGIINCAEQYSHCNHHKLARTVTCLRVYIHTISHKHTRTVTCLRVHIHATITHKHAQ